MTATGLKRTAVLCILRHGDELLLMRRTKTLHQGLYVPVGGKVDPYEGPKAAALREVHEEAGVVLSDAQFCGVMVETSPVDYNWVSFIYIADIPRCEPIPCVEGVLEWVPVAHLSDYPLLESDRFIYPYVLAGRPFVFDVIYDAEIRILRMVDELSGKVLHASGG
jgi:8-oxo-dGTP diphosphatase